MKDQLRLLRDCINNERPAVVFQGDDFCAPEILEAAKEIYRKHGCSEEFLFDWQLLINEVKAYQLESPATPPAPPHDAKLAPDHSRGLGDLYKRQERCSFIQSRIPISFLSFTYLVNGSIVLHASNPSIFMWRAILG